MSLVPGSDVNQVITNTFLQESNEKINEAERVTLDCVGTEFMLICLIVLKCFSQYQKV